MNSIQEDLKSREFKIPSTIFTKLSDNGEWLIWNSEFPSWTRINQSGYDVLQKFYKGNSFEKLIKNYNVSPSIESKLLNFIQVFVKKKILIPANHLPPSAKKKRKSQKFKLNDMHILITKECNLKCVHCIYDAGVSTDNELTLEEIYNILNDFKKLGGRAVIFSGGEPFLRKDLRKILMHAGDLKLEKWIVSNGQI